MRLIFATAFVVSGCAVHYVETYALTGDALENARAARDAAQKLGWPVDSTAENQLRLPSVPSGRRGAALEVFAVDGGLRIEGNAPPNLAGVAPLAPASTVLVATAARARAAPTVVPELAAKTDPQTLSEPPLARLAAPELSLPVPAALQIHERSTVGVVGLDLLLPAAGALYALTGDPFHDSPAAAWGGSAWASFFVRLGLDAAWATLTVVDLARPQVEVSWWEWLVPVEMLVLNRFSALMADLWALPFRNAYARSGLPALEEPVPRPLSVTSRPL